MNDSTKDTTDGRPAMAETNAVTVTTTATFADELVFREDERPSMPFKLDHRPYDQAFVYDEQRLVEENIDLSSNLQWYFISSTTEVVFFYWIEHLQDKQGSRITRLDDIETELMLLHEITSNSRTRAKEYKLVPCSHDTSATVVECFVPETTRKELKALFLESIKVPNVTTNRNGDSDSDRGVYNIRSSDADIEDSQDVELGTGDSARAALEEDSETDLGECCDNSLIIADTSLEITPTNDITPKASTFSSAYYNTNEFTGSPTPKSKRLEKSDTSMSYLRSSVPSMSSDEFCSSKSSNSLVSSASKISLRSSVSSVSSVSTQSSSAYERRLTSNFIKSAIDALEKSKRNQSRRRNRSSVDSIGSIESLGSLDSHATLESLESLAVSLNSIDFEADVDSDLELETALGDKRKKNDSSPKSLDLESKMIKNASSRLFLPVGILRTRKTSDQVLEDSDSAAQTTYNVRFRL